MVHNCQLGAVCKNIDEMEMFFEKRICFFKQLRFTLSGISYIQLFLFSLLPIKRNPCIFTKVAKIGNILKILLILAFTSQKLVLNFGGLVSYVFCLYHFVNSVLYFALRLFMIFFILLLIILSKLKVRRQESYL